MCSTDIIRAQILCTYKGQQALFFDILKKPYKSRAQDMGDAPIEKDRKSVTLCLLYAQILCHNHFRRNTQPHTKEATMYTKTPAKSHSIARAVTREQRYSSTGEYWYSMNFTKNAKGEKLERAHRENAVCTTDRTEYYAACRALRSGGFVAKVKLDVMMDSDIDVTTFVPVEPTPAPAAAPAQCDQPLVVAYGGGVDSTAMIVGMQARGIRPDAILFADVGAEKEETYAFIKDHMNPWLASVGFPQVVTVRYQAQNFKHYPPYRTLEENCLTNGTLPSEAFGFGSCSQKWKATPQKKWLQQWAPAIAVWARGENIKRAVGYDDSGADKKRSCKSMQIVEKGFDNWYPLQEWHWNREECKRQIALAGLPVPPKSSCFFCPNMQKEEVAALPAEKLRRIVLIEARAKPRLIKIDGLWRTGCKGMKDPSKKRPGRMSDFIREEGLLPAAEIDAIEANAPQELIDRAEQFANGMEIQEWSEVLANIGEGACIAI